MYFSIFKVQMSKNFASGGGPTWTGILCEGRTHLCGERSHVTDTPVEVRGRWKGEGNTIYIEMIKHVEHYIGTDNIYWNDEKNIVFDDKNTVRETLRDPWR